MWRRRDEKKEGNVGKRGAEEKMGRRETEICRKMGR